MTDYSTMAFYFHGVIENAIMSLEEIEQTLQYVGIAPLDMNEAKTLKKKLFFLMKKYHIIIKIAYVIQEWLIFNTMNI